MGHREPTPDRLSGTQPDTIAEEGSTTDHPMKERATTPSGNEPISEAPPPYEQINRGLTSLLHELGQSVRDGFPPGKALIDYNRATDAIVLHPWLPVRLRAEFLLDAAVSRLETVEYERRLAASDDDEGGGEIRWHQGDDEPWRATVVKLAAGRELGMVAEATADAEDDELSPSEQRAVALIVGAVAD